MQLGLRLGRHADGLVDAYYGPAELAAEVAAESPREPAELASGARALAADIETDPSLEPGRRAWLGDQVRGVATFAGVLAGEEWSYADEVEACFGVRPERGSEAVYAEAHAVLADLLPGDGDLRDRYELWRAGETVSPSSVVGVLTDLLGTLRRATARVVELPAGESIEVEPVSDEPWWAFNYYEGDLRSRVALNLDIATTAADLVTLAAHEAYPGHHTEHAVKERSLIQERGWLEESIQLVPTPRSLVGEGIAEAGLDVVLDEPLRDELTAILAHNGLATDLARAFAIRRARTALGSVSLDAALMIHEEGASLEEAQAHVERWALSTAERAAHSIRFVTDPTWRAYVITYSAGERLCRAFLEPDPGRLTRLLTEQVRVVDLLGDADQRTPS